MIAVCLPGCIDLAVSALSILHAECIYLPLDSEYPQSRLLFMLEDSGAQLVIVNNETAGIFAGINIKMLNLEQTSIEPQPLQKTDLNSDIPAYLIYTSGSTGKPKGVLISNRSLINHNLGAIEIYELSSTDRILQFSSLSFDISIEEMFPGWLAGSAMVFRNIEAKSSVNGFLDFIKHKKITVADLPTAFWHELVQNMSSRDMPDDLRAVIVGGEKVNLEHYKEWLNLTGKKISFYNTYGPTETSVIASYCKGKDENNWEVFPIGIPVPNCSLYVLDSRMKFRPMGLSGNLYIGGEGVAIGYHNREKANYNAFKINPYTQQKVFHSGDTVRFNRNNELEFMGRKDAQLKISGFRIEPEEIVRVIESFQNVKQAFVDIHNAENVKLLTAWIQSDKINLKELTRHLKQFLPAYMIPARFIVMRTLPINANGKIDRKLLPAPTEGDLQRNLVEPYNEFQRLLCRLFQDILNIKKVGIKDNFFKLGGNSLLAMKLISLVNNAGMELSINDLFKHENIEDLSLSLKYNAPRQKTAHEFSLVEIQKTAGNTLPLVVCHLSPGDLIGYSALFQEMSKSVSVYGMQSPALFNDEYDFDSISELAKWYIDLLDKHFGNTDYVLFGHCFGGTLAYEIAYQLEMQKRPIAKLVLSETWLFPPRSGLKKWHYRLHKIRNVFRMDPGDFIYYLKVKLFKHNAVSPFVEIKEEGLDNPLFLKRVELQNKHLRQVLSYQYPKLQQHINLFIAKNYPKGLIPDPTLGWNVITKRYSIYRFEAEHKNILWKPAVKDMANALKDICKRR